MTALTNRGRVSTGRKRKQKIPEPTIVSDEESVEDESVTRCVCGESHSVGLMVCCDQCEVWQHCDCMGLEEQDIPEHYYCELCKPNDHIEIKGYDRTRRYYKPSSPSASDSDKRTPKRRTTFNSREASISLEEVLALRNAIEQSKTNDSSELEIDSEVNASSVDSDEVQKEGMPFEVEESEVMAKTTTKRQYKKSEDKICTKSKVEKKTRPTNTRRTNSSQSNHSSRRMNKTTRSRTSTPQPEIQTPISASTALFEQLSQSARETSPPAKIRVPSARMTIPEMNRRANQILEYICSMQVKMITSKRERERREQGEDEDDEDNEENKRQLLDARISEAMTKVAMQIDEESEFGAGTEGRSSQCRRPTPILIPGKANNSSSTSSSLSSASTIPLDEEHLMNDEKSMAQIALEQVRRPEGEQSSMEIMDLLTREVITFQRKFGPLGYRHSFDCASNESDGPVTRSRDMTDRSFETTW
ncbi:hypothetical protein BDB01DRAFT_783079 [Pilobolus umbonatus]|nr:hypothetical protein BDB01DRAFT_783079 [Pilobolus umbonatus]